MFRRCHLQCYYKQQKRGVNIISESKHVLLIELQEYKITDLYLWFDLSFILYEPNIYILDQVISLLEFIEVDQLGAWIKVELCSNWFSMLNFYFECFSNLLVWKLCHNTLKMTTLWTTVTNFYQCLNRPFKILWN